LSINGFGNETLSWCKTYQKAFMKNYQINPFTPNYPLHSEPFCQLSHGGKLLPFSMLNATKSDYYQNNSMTIKQTFTPKYLQ